MIKVGDTLPASKLSPCLQCLAHIRQHALQNMSLAMLSTLPSSRPQAWMKSGASVSMMHL